MSDYKSMETMLRAQLLIKAWRLPHVVILIIGERKVDKYRGGSGAGNPRSSWRPDPIGM